MIPKRLVAIEDQLRLACDQHRYGAVDRLALAFGDAARREIGALAPGDPETARIGQYVLAALERSRLTALAGRARTAAKLRCIPFLNRYRVKPPQRPSMVRIDA